MSSVNMPFFMNDVWELVKQCIPEIFVIASTLPVAFAENASSGKAGEFDGDVIGIRLRTASDDVKRIDLNNRMTAMGQIDETTRT
jgi:hypothetical protein